jgi:hypothetical protein
MVLKMYSLCFCPPSIQLELLPGNFIYSYNFEHLAFSAILRSDTLRVHFHLLELICIICNTRGKKGGGELNAVHLIKEITQP